MTFAQLNALDPVTARQALLRCCGSTRWADQMIASRPFPNVDAMIAAADAVWSSLDRTDWLEAFAAHPQIGAAPAGGETAAGWAADEQAGAAAGSAGVRERLAAKNREYLARFGYIFIVCATGKSAEAMLRILEHRLPNDPGAELREAVEQQRQITRLRLAKLLEVAVA